MATYEFKFKPSEDIESEDSQYDMLVDGKPVRIAVQDCRSYGGGYSIHSYGGNEGDGSFCMKLHGSERTLVVAKKRAINVYESNKHLDAEMKKEEPNG